MPRRSVRYGALVAVGAAVAVGALATLWPDSSPPRRPSPPPPVNHIAQNIRACLLTDGSPAGLEVWKALQEMANSSTLNAQQEVQPPNTDGDSSYLNGLVQQRCTLIFVVGDSPASAVDATARSHPEVLFATSGGTGTVISNVVRLASDHDAASNVHALVDKARSRH